MPRIRLPPLLTPLSSASRTLRSRAPAGLRGLLLILCFASAFGAAGPCVASAADGLAALQGDLGHQLALAGARSSAYVYDLTAKQALFSRRATVLRPPASIEKLYTATAALELMGPSARLSTTVLGVGQLGPGGAWEGDLYLRGGGDPTFGSTPFIHSHYGGEGASLSTLVEQIVRTDGIRSVTGSIEGDESYLDSLRGEPSSAYGSDPFLEGTLSGLAFNRGATGPVKGRHAPAAYVARQLRAALGADGVTIHGAAGAASTPAGAIQLAQVQSPTLAQMLGLMLPASDNFFAETLIKDLGAGFAGAGTTVAGASVVTRTIAALLGIHPRAVDGSGLSSANRTSAYQVADLLAELAPTAVGGVLRGELAVAGRTGTLARRMRNTGAAGRCEGKTGTLTGASNLAGYCQSSNGHLLAFAIFIDGTSIEAARRIQDHMAITIADY